MAFTLSAAPTPGLRDSEILADVRTTQTSTRAAQASRTGPVAHEGAAAGTPYRKTTLVSVHIGSRRRERQRSQATAARTGPCRSTIRRTDQAPPARPARPAGQPPTTETAPPTWPRAPQPGAGPVAARTKRHRASPPRAGLSLRPAATTDRRAR